MGTGIAVLKVKEIRKTIHNNKWWFLKAEPFKRWLAKVGYERVQEIEDLNPILLAYSFVLPVSRG